MTLSVQPRKKPAIRPSATPITRLMITAVTPIKIDTVAGQNNAAQHVAAKLVGAQYPGFSVERFHRQQEAGAEILGVRVISRQDRDNEDEQQDTSKKCDAEPCR